MQPLPYHAGLAAHLLRRLQSITAFSACSCPLHLSMSGEPLTQKQSSQFLPAAPGIRPCATRRTLAPRRRSRVPCSTDRVEHDVGVPRLPLHRCVLDRLAGAGDGVQKPHAPRLPASPGDAVAQRGRCHRWGLGGKPSRLRRIMRALQDDTLRVFWAARFSALLLSPLACAFRCIGWPSGLPSNRS